LSLLIYSSDKVLGLGSFVFRIVTTVVAENDMFIFFSLVVPVAAGSRLTFFARAKESKQRNTPSVCPLLPSAITDILTP
jgi:hypothetical protein